MSSIDVLPSTRTPVQRATERERKERLRTFHDELHIADETMNNLKRLCSSHASFVQGEPVQPLENILDLAFS